MVNIHQMPKPVIAAINGPAMGGAAKLESVRREIRLRPLKFFYCLFKDISMPRIKLEEQPEYEFRYEYTVQHRDINYGVHLGNDAIILLTNVAMMNLFRSLGFTDPSLLGDGKTGKIMVDLGANYKSEGHMFDVIHIDSHIGEINHNSFRIFHQVTRDKELLALVETGFLAFDNAMGKPAPVPTEFLQKLDAWCERKRGSKLNT